MVHPNLGGFLDCDGISSASQNLGDLNVTDDNVRLLEDAEAHTGQSYQKISDLEVASKNWDAQEPAFPRTDVLDPTFTTAFPVILPGILVSSRRTGTFEKVGSPEIITVFFAVPATAEVNAAREVTVTVVPPAPPVVPMAKPISAVSVVVARLTSSTGAASAT